MAEEQKPVAVPETTPAVAEPVAEPVVETKPAEDKPAEEAPVTEAAAETTAEETPAAEEAKEVKPIEAGTLEHKGAPANFPKYVRWTGWVFFLFLIHAPALSFSPSSLTCQLQELAICQEPFLVWSRCAGEGEAVDLLEE